MYEFDPDDAGDGGAGRRRMVHWDGAIGEPAADVVLEWTNDEASVLVCTTDRIFDAAYARFRAAHLALGGTFLPAAGRPVGPTRIVRAMERLRDDDDAWSPIPGLVPEAFHGTVTATASESADCDGYALAYTLFDGGAVFVVAVGVPPERFRLRVAGRLIA
jgi:hypothetical protein